MLVSGICFELGLEHGGGPFLSPSAKGGLGYFRLHGIGGFRYRHSAATCGGCWSFVPATSRCYCRFNTIAMSEDGCRFHALAVDRPAE